MRRRDFIKAVAGSASFWPLAVRAQQGERLRRIGVLIPGASDDREFQAHLAAFLQGLQQLGWVGGRNVRIDTRFGAADADLIFVNRRWSWWGSGRTSSWLIAPTRCLPCCRRPALFRSFSRPSPIRSAPAMSRVWHGRVGA